MSPYIANLSTLYGKLPRDERPQAAADAGFSRVESWWDFDVATPAAVELAGFLTAIERAGVRLVAMNSHGGDRAAGERGLACLPDRREEFQRSIESLVGVAEVTAARKFNVTFGQLDEARWTREEQFETAEQNYRWAAAQVAAFDGVILIEALAADGNGGYPFHTGYDVVEFLDEHLPDVENVGFLFDTFHLASNGVDVLRAFDDLSAKIGHVQFADFPGRGAPGTGRIDFHALIKTIEKSTYTGDISLEYVAGSPGKP